MKISIALFLKRYKSFTFTSNPLNDTELESSLYTHAFDNNTHVLLVTVDYVLDGVEACLQYTINLTLIDTTAYRLYNGDFEKVI